MMKMPKIKAESGKRCIRITINEYKPIVEFNFISEEPKPSFEIQGNELFALFGDQQVKIKISEDKDKILITKKIGIKEFILGFGEKALPLNKRRSRLVFWNYDNYSYSWYSDPLYISVPFGIFVNDNKAIGIFLNTPAFCIADLGLKEYDEATFEIYDQGLELYLIFGPKIEDVLKTYFEITGKPFLPPSWALGYQISRYSYFPQEYVIEIAKEFLKEVSLYAIYLDIDYMKDYKIFTWNENRFPNPKEMISKLHELGIKVITIIDPYIKVEEDYEMYEEARKFSVMNKNKEAYIVKGWPGACIIPDFFNKETREWWAKKIKEFVENYSIDGIWLDMNEPSVFNEIKSIFEIFKNDIDKEYLISRINEIVFLNKPLKPSIRIINFKPEHFYDRSLDPNALHRLDDGRVIEHRFVRNAYPYFQAKATFEALKSFLERPFILSRSGYAGIQKYAAVWTGDVPSTWEDLRLTIAMLLNLSISGLTFCGSDIGGFVGRTDYELIARWHQACAFMPLFRLHKDKGASEAEIYNLPSKYRKMIKEAIELRYKFLPYLWHLCIKAHIEGEPIIRPLCYDFQEEECFYIEDEYLIGPSLLFAPIIEKGREEREVYLPKDEWFDFWNRNTIQGGKYVIIKASMPLFIRKNSAIPIQKGFLIFGEGEWDIYYGEDCKKAKVIFKNNILELYSEMDINEIIILGKKLYSKEVKTLVDNLGTNIILENKLNNIELFNF